MKRPILAALVVVLAAAGWGTYLALRPGIMPLDVQTMEAYQYANSAAVMRLMDERPNLSNREIEALAFNEAVKEIGHSPERSRAYWSSDEFKIQLDALEPADRINLLRLSERLVRTASFSN
jgi:hypothetical protein